MAAVPLRSFATKTKDDEASEKVEDKPAKPRNRKPKEVKLVTEEALSEPTPAKKSRKSSKSSSA